MGNISEKACGYVSKILAYTILQSDVPRLLGAKEYLYDEIDWSKLEYCPSRFALQKISATAGHFVSVGIQLGIGGLNKRFLDSNNLSYRELVHFAQQSVLVNLYDVADRRSWLLDGASAILLLSRTQLSHHNSPHSESGSLEVKAFRHVNTRGGTKAATDVLLDESDIKLVLSEDPEETSVETTQKGNTRTSETKTKVTKRSFHELVKRNAALFEMLHDYQNLLLEPDGVNLRTTVRERLEGWEFLEIVSGERSLRPRVQYLKSISRGWVDFTREIGAINLFAKGFGNLLEPAADADKLCRYWKEVPRKNDYLAVCISTLDNICRKHGDSQANPFKLTSQSTGTRPIFSLRIVSRL